LKRATGAATALEARLPAAPMAPCRPAREAVRKSARRAALSAAIALASSLLATPCRANSLEVCDKPSEPTADQKDVMLRFGAIVRGELGGSGGAIALISRSGLDLHRIHVRYSHEGVALAGDGGTWAVRELYYSCDDRRPRLFDEGLAGFILGTDDPENGWISLVFLPPADADRLRRAAADKRQALSVLGSTYSANAYPFSTQFQNCNQWVMELLASAWVAPGDRFDDDRRGRPPSFTAEAAIAAGEHPERDRAQRWLYSQGYRPTQFTVSARPLMWLARAVPWMSNADHPDDDLAQDRYTVSMPASIETFVQAKVAGATRIEACHAGRRVVVHRGWDDIADGCVPGPGDQVMELSAE